mmetsp:Transcript_6891/g.11161  ORF Transcript_6891/g.11161 Transcript_6891/m.11161 type:complete len:128 (-) Transcript_6891:314-697(-)|eukprot:CAMPEP_0171488360 /NCGR_PEP_ID=MMETSP0958-20121227/2161_1 /TAXON_ID=87120 /ORGANISM="Aurantiochytrium limacinum, Strain ATCCMYA-1381" /LENGTH=127 /DNA_ID=CAMNT_0012021459 /DNA_START=1310 /DNA_END=1693 /DNA_ORIENTATION=+
MTAVLGQHYEAKMKACLRYDDEGDDLAQVLAVRMESLCTLCPDFLLAAVLEGVLGEIVMDLSEDRLEEVTRRLKNSHKPANAAGFRIGMKVLEDCVEEGPKVFFKRLSAMSAADMALWRGDLENLSL